MKKLVAIALLLALLSGLGVFTFAKYLEKLSDIPKKPVVVAATSIPKNTVIRSDMLKTVDFPVEAIHQYSAKTIPEVVGKITLEDIFAEEQVLTVKLNSSEDKKGELAYQVKEGFRAVTIEVNEFSGVGEYIKKGDRVDLIALLVGESAISSQVALENAEVLAVGKNNSQGADNQALVTSITISVPAKDLTKVHYALSEGKYRLSLRSAVDNKPSSSPAYTFK